MGKKKIVVVIPTYNERENIGQVLESILQLNSNFDLTVLVVDDNSPDGTAKIVQEMAAKDFRVGLLLRTKRRGRGTAGAAGFQAALELNPDYVIEMDGDGSHQPVFIPNLVKAAEKADLVLGSRYVPGGQDAERSWLRRLITWLVRLFIRWQFGFQVKDVSSGFRCFQAEALRKIDPEDLISTGPSIVLEVLAKARQLGLKITEVPINFVDRKAGQTKLTFLTLLETFVMALKFKRMYASQRAGK